MRHVQTAAVENLDDFRFSAPVAAKRTAEYSLRFCEMTRVISELVDAGDGSDRDCEWQIGVPSAVGIARCLGAFTRTSCIHVAGGVCTNL